MKTTVLHTYIKRNTPYYVFYFVMLALQMWLRVLAPTKLGSIIDSVFGLGQRNLFWILLLEMFFAYVFAGVFGYFAEFSADKISKRTGNYLRQDVFKAVTAQDGGFFAERTPADLMSRTTSDTENIGFLYGFCGLFAIQLVIHVLVQFIALLRVSPRCAIIPALCLPIIGYLAIASERKGDQISDAISDKRADLNQAASEAIGGIRTVKSFGKEAKERMRFGKEASLFRGLSTSFDTLWVNWCTPESMVALMMAPLVILVGGVEIIQGHMSLGELSIALEYTAELSWPMMEIGWLLVEISSARAGWRKVKKILERKSSIKDGTKTLASQEGTLTFEHVSLVDKERTLLEDISFTLPPGKTLAIMGASGSGKSLVASLAVRFLDPTSGRITINGVDMRELTLSSARGFSSIVTQDVFLFSDTVKNNIALGNRKEAPEEKIRLAAQKAEATTFIEKLENGWDTIIGEKGVGLSGGQKQRLSIARAFMKENQLLILDDATSALDMETERDIERTIREEGSRSLLITAHRISAVATADEILVLDKGRIAERGTHKELLAKKGLYYETYISQYPEEGAKA